MRKRREELRDPDMLPDDLQPTALDRHVQSKIMVTELWSALDTLDELSRTIIVPAKSSSSRTKRSRTRSSCRSRP